MLLGGHFEHFWALSSYICGVGVWKVLFVASDMSVGLTVLNTLSCVRIRVFSKQSSLDILLIQQNTPTGASTNPNNFDLNKNLNMNLIQIET